MSKIVGISGWVLVFSADARAYVGSAYETISPVVDATLSGFGSLSKWLGSLDNQFATGANWVLVIGALLIAAVLILSVLASMISCFSFLANGSSNGGGSGEAGPSKGLKDRWYYALDGAPGAKRLSYYPRGEVQALSYSEAMNAVQLKHQSHLRQNNSHKMIIAEVSHQPCQMRKG